MQDRSRAAATALCSGMSDSRLASAAATTGLTQAGSAKGIPFSLFQAPGIASSKDQLKAGTHKRIQGSLGITCGCAVRGAERGDLIAWNILSAGDLDRSAADLTAVVAAAAARHKDAIVSSDG